MERVYRSGLDIDVALATAVRRTMATDKENSPGAALTAESAVVAAAAAPQAQDAGRQHWRSRVKRWLRKPAAFGFRLAKPFLRPLAFRTRRYLTEAMHQDILRVLAETQREVQRASSDMLREVQSAREILRQEIIATQARLLDERASTHDAALQTLADGQQELAQLFARTLDQFAPKLDRIEQYGYASARRALMHCAADEVMVKTEVGYVMCSDTDLALLATLIDAGDLERGTRLLIQQIVQPGDTFVDVGTNVGLHTLAAGRALQGRGRIVAFEPFEGTRRLLEKTIWINGLSQLTELHGNAVWDREGVKTLYLGATSGHHSLFELGNDKSAAPSVEVSTVTLEGVLGPACRVDLLKIDAEGAELEVLHGALSIIQANPDIGLIVEFGPSHLQRNAHTSADWLAAFTDLGLEYRAIDANTGALSEVGVAELEAAESTNLFFSRPGARLWSRTGKPA